MRGIPSPDTAVIWPMLHPIPVAHLDAAWPHVEAMLEAATATSRGRETAFDIRRAVRAEDAQLWLWWDDSRRKATAVAVTQIVLHPRKKACRIRIVTGEDMGAWLDQGLAELEAWARSLGCELMEANARPGWGRVMKGRGYQVGHHFIEREL